MWMQFPYLMVKHGRQLGKFVHPHLEQNHEVIVDVTTCLRTRPLCTDSRIETELKLAQIQEKGETQLLRKVSLLINARGGLTSPV